ncbi:hypothetical protein B9Z55_008158 [Caenorhabditis nigoni]|uniref:Uncharacterized protein n=1 Tax=Caenorhabditis nigoni TaxID=1611254 RepID=A0A2G5VCW2_9PELO|nr:hypothetical protein B9Z55_008158 [Caenorhabditis nigoni]
MLGFKTILIMLLQLSTFLPILIFCSKSQKKDTGKSAKNAKNRKKKPEKSKSKTGLAATEEPNSNKGAEEKKDAGNPEDVKKDAPEAPEAPEPVRKEIESETF